MKPVILNSPESMTRVRVVTLRDYSEPALKALHKEGVLHVAEAKELAPVDRLAIENQQKEVAELRAFVSSMLSYIAEKERVELGEDVEVIYTRPFGEITREVRSLYAEFAELGEKTARINREISELTEQGKYLGALTQQLDVRLKDLDFSGDYLFSRVFVLSNEGYEGLRDELRRHLFESTSVEVDGETVIYALGKMGNLKAVESLIGGAGGEILLVPDEDLTLREFLKKTEARLGELGERLAELYAGLRGRSKEELRRIALLRSVLVAESQRLAVLARAAEAKYVTLIEGWVPDSSLESLITELKTNIDYVFIDVKKPEPSEEPPTKLKNPTALRPFQVVVNLFATPKYREWDPTPIIAYSFATFFGLMIADVGYAIGLMVFARFLLGKILGDSESEGFRLFQRLIYISSGVALVLGLLTGNYLGDIYLFFGFENLSLVAGVRQMLQSPITFVILAIFIGWVHVNIAHITALVKAVREKNQGAIINKVGLLVIQFGAFWLLRVLMNIDIPNVLGVIMTFPKVAPQVYNLAMYGTFAGVALIIFGNYRERGGIGAILGIFDITGLLGDVMSYSRLAGVGLATFYLGSAFNMLARVLSGMIPLSGVAGAVVGTILAIVIVIIGQAINLLLSLLTGIVHSLRLCFVEFLLKFYEGGGIHYSPFRLRKRASMLVGEKS
jgi:V/A-type H+-transporting ATPase subunit I